MRRDIKWPDICLMTTNECFFSQLYEKTKNFISILRDVYASVWNLPPFHFFCMEHVFYEFSQTHVSSCNVTAYAPLFVCHRLNPVMASRLVAGLVVQVTLNRVPVCPGSGFTTYNRKCKWGSLKYKVCETRHRIYMKGMLSVLVCL